MRSRARATQFAAVQIYTAYPKYKNRAPESEDEEKEERMAKARERGNFVWLDISIPPGISPGMVCKVVDGDAREHYIKIPPLVTNFPLQFLRALQTLTLASAAGQDGEGGCERGGESEGVRCTRGR